MITSMITLLAGKTRETNLDARDVYGGNLYLAPTSDHSMVAYKATFGFCKVTVSVFCRYTPMKMFCNISVVGGK